MRADRITPRDALAVNAAALTAVMVRAVDNPIQFAELLDDKRLNACVIGPGAGVSARTRDFVHTALSARRHLVLDADALTSFAGSPDRLFEAIKAAEGLGVVLTPQTPAKALDYLLEEVDLVLIMSVNPGFGGQAFIESSLRKIEAVRKMIDKGGYAVDLEVDGGIDLVTAPRAISAGADALVAGTATFRGGPAAYAANIAGLRG